MAKLPSVEDLAKEVALSALDDFKYEGRTLREWAGLVVSGRLVETAQHVEHCSVSNITALLTNADRIRSMTDVELAAYLADDDRCCPPDHPDCRKYVNSCAGCFLEWLQKPAEAAE